MSGIVQQNSGTTTGTSIAVAFNNPVSKNNLIIVGIFTPSTNPSSIGDSGSNVYNIASDGPGTGGFEFNVYYAVASANGTPTITVNFPSSTEAHLHIFEVSGGYNTAEQFGVNYQSTNTENGTVSTSGSTVHAKSFVFAMFADNFGSGVTWAPGSGFTAGQTTDNGNVVFSEGGEITGAGVQTATASQNFSSVIGSVIATFYPSAGSPTITTTGLPNGSQVQAYSATLAATGGTPPYSWAIISGSLPPGLTLNSSTGVISGTPTQSGFFSFGVQVTDATSATATANLSITVAVLLAGGYWANQGQVDKKSAVKRPDDPLPPWWNWK
jgi:hypothetical protein